MKMIEWADEFSEDKRSHIGVWICSEDFQMMAS